MRHLFTILALTVVPMSAAAAQSEPPKPPAPASAAPPVPAAERQEPARPTGPATPKSAPSPHPVVAPYGLPAEELEWHVAQLHETEQAMEEARLAMERARVIRLEAFSNAPYELGLRLLERRSYEEAIAQFDRTVTDAPETADAARYWKAFAEYKIGQTDEALATLGVLRRQHPQSRYLADARVLETEVRRTAGSPVNPADLDDDEIKLLAINAMQYSDPARATPLLEGVLQSTSSLRVKRQALFVLAQSDQPRAREILMSYARGSGNPDLQRRAIEYLMAADGDNAALDLTSLYQSTTDATVRRTIIDALASRRQADALVTLARQESDRDLKTAIVRRLSAMASNSPAAQEYLMEVIR